DRGRNPELSRHAPGDGNLGGQAAAVVAGLSSLSSFEAASHNKDVDGRDDLRIKSGDGHDGRGKTIRPDPCRRCLFALPSRAWQVTVFVDNSERSQPAVRSKRFFKV